MYYNNKFTYIFSFLSLFFHCAKITSIKHFFVLKLWILENGKRKIFAVAWEKNSINEMIFFKFHIWLNSVRDLYLYIRYNMIILSICLGKLKLLCITLSNLRMNLLFYCCRFCRRITGEIIEFMNFFWNLTTFNLKDWKDLSWIWL